MWGNSTDLKSGGAAVTPVSSLGARPSTNTSRNKNGPHEANCPQVHRRQGAPQAARHQGGAQVGPGHGRRQEAAPLPPRHGRAPRDPPLPEVHGAPRAQAAVPAPRARDRAGLQDGPPLPGLRRPRAPGGRRGLPRGPLRGHEPLRDPRQARHDHAQGHPARAPHPRRALVSVSTFFGGDVFRPLTTYPVSSETTLLPTKRRPTWLCCFPAPASRSPSFPRNFLASSSTASFAPIIG